ncbi:hypothetical protein EC973_003269 [Apophysomyces ossiformis]|uniref:Protein phosphatase n=1 Tax=Apophysomyces ossiformis TaxID=679940 RepID=A0A8H7ETC6_9FUNG|nr:hypothetical protein EC973_003269 [Apophysomyces ossiformis]
MAAFKAVGTTTTTITASVSAAAMRSVTGRRLLPLALLMKQQHTHRSFSTTPSSTSLATATQSSYNYDYSQPITKSLPIYDFFSQPKPKPSFNFAYGAAGIAKRGRQTQSNECYQSIQVGEDAYFYRSDALGVADGVGGWIGTAGANAALYSRKLMHHAFLEMERFDNIEDPLFCMHEKANPVEVLQHSYEACLREAKQEGIVGSSTACLAVLRGDELRVANLGDCGISVIRNNGYVFRSEEQQHSFNYPYQLGTQSRDRPNHAQTFNVNVERNDIIIMGSDGLFDNLFDKEILTIVQSHVAAHTLPGSDGRSPRLLNFNPQALADALASEAQAVSENQRHLDSPFQRKAMNEGLYYQGGKADDISVLVAIVRDSEDSPDRRL